MKKYLLILLTLITIVVTTACSSNALDTTFECDYLKIAKCSKWEEKNDIHGKYVDVSWRLDDKSLNTISIYLSESIFGKQSQSDLQKEYDERDKEVIDSFVKNGQAYIITGDSENRTLYFSTDKVEGTIFYSAKDEEIVMKMIESIEFY